MPVVIITDFMTPYDHFGDFVEFTDKLRLNVSPSLLVPLSGARTD